MGDLAHVHVVVAPCTGDEESCFLGYLVTWVVVGQICVGVRPVPSVTAHNHPPAIEEEGGYVLVVVVVMAIPELVQKAVQSRQVIGGN